MQMPHTHDEVLALANSDQFSRKCACIAGLAFLTWDTVSNFDKEYIFVFNPPSRVKFLYLFARYFGIGSQIFSVFYTTRHLSTTPIPSETCRRWFYFQIITIMALQTSVEVILILRVYALYRKSTLVGYILTFAILAEICLGVYLAVSAFDSLEYNAACIVTAASREMARVGGCIGVTQTIIWGFALYKYRQGLQEGWADIPVVSRVMRDGSSTFVAIIAMLLVFVPVFFRVKDIAHIAVPLITCAFSVLACRLIINMHNLKQSPPEAVDVELTSALEMSFVESRRSLETIFLATADIP
ncbi:hypothetical protein GALMADRAFT_558548 [Galerina marginata CBS 339.88]|uniref:DUF6533 domain-containing protein n=1 Tax=Galerina marginata (strain CBS 339.88) TaxID=685588 RepID=A0A067SX19_GALM3|nr:hypothetical protein GALMADRAFT_558548 [Galerina marginata CBS 339.88]